MRWEPRRYAVGTSYADLTYVFEAAREFAPHLRDFTVVVNKSTVPVGTARQVARIISGINPGASFAVASNPEFLREGAAINDFMRPDRVVLGADSESGRRDPARHLPSPVPDRNAFCGHDH